jgi:hypothetical protein
METWFITSSPDAGEQARMYKFDLAWSLIYPIFLN